MMLVFEERHRPLLHDQAGLALVFVLGRRAALHVGDDDPARGPLFALADALPHITSSRSAPTTWSSSIIQPMSCQMRSAAVSARAHVQRGHQLESFVLFSVVK